MQESFFVDIPLWIVWLSLAFLLIAGEIMTAGFVIIWFAIGAFLTGILSLLLPDLPYWVQIMVFSVTSLLFLLTVGRALHKRRKERQKNTIEPHNRTHSYLGRSYHVQKDFVDGVGHLQVEDTIWRAEGDGVKAGMTVKVIKADGNTLFVHPVSS